MATEYIVRPYQTRDRELVLKIASDTAFFGEPVELFLEDRHIFMDAFYSYYVDQEPEHAWVTTYQGEVIGFLTGCTNTQRQETWFSKHGVPHVIKNLMRGAYKTGPLTWRCLRAYLFTFLRREGTNADLSLYPAHLHINIDHQHRGAGLGRQLIQSYLEQLKNLQVPGVHLQTTSENISACILYEKIGFSQLSSHSSQMWRWKLGRNIENRCYGLKI